MGAGARTGAVTLIQRFGSAPSLNIHLHMLFANGVYRFDEERPRFHRGSAPTQSELQRRTPVRGESIVEAGFRFTVEEASERTELKLRVEPVGTATPAGGGRRQRRLTRRTRNHPAMIDRRPVRSLPGHAGAGFVSGSRLAASDVSRG